MILEALSKKERDNLHDSDFGIPSLRKYPLIDVQHVKSAISYFGKCDDEHKLELAKNIMRAAVVHHVEISTNTQFYKYIKSNNKISEHDMRSLLLKESCDYMILKEFVDIPDVARWNSLTDRPVLVYSYADRLEFYDHNLKDGVCITKTSEFIDVDKPRDDYDGIILVNFEAEEGVKFIKRMRDDHMDRDLLREIIGVYTGHETVPFITMVINYYGYFINEEHAMALCGKNIIDTLAKIYTRDNHTYTDSRCIKSFDMILFKDVKDKNELLYNTICNMEMCPSHLEYIRRVIVEHINLHHLYKGGMLVNKTLQILYDKYVSGATHIKQYMMVDVLFKYRYKILDISREEIEWFK